MPSVFSDISGNDRDLSITTSADWTITTGDLPNGDNSASLVTALNENARWNGEEFCIPVGSGTECLSVEVWVKVTANTNIRSIAQVRDNGTANSGRHWWVYLDASEIINASWHQTSTGAVHRSAATSALAAGWHHIVVLFRGGSTRNVQIYIDGASAATSSSSAGTATDATSGTYLLYVGTDRALATSEMTDHMAKLAIYTRELTSSEILEHYTIMTAT